MIKRFLPLDRAYSLGMTVILITSVLLSSCYEQETKDNNFKVRRVAHAGGGINDVTYTNSFEALNSNLEKGFIYFELDFSFTKDGKLVCIHDWQGSFSRSFGFAARERPTLDTFNFLVGHVSDYQKCTLEGLVDWMERNPEAILVTDIKESNLQALYLMSKTIPEFGEKVIPQIYQPKNYELVKEMGYKNVIWTLYRYSGSQNQVLDWVDSFQGDFAITMPRARAATELPKELAGKNVPTYVHTINEREEAEAFFKHGLTEVYTDFLPAMDIEAH